MMATEINSLKAWMERRGMDAEQLRSAMIPTARLGTFRKSLDGRMPITDYFKRCFFNAFGVEATREVFDIEINEKMLNQYGGEAWRPNYHRAHRAVTTAIKEGKMQPAKAFECHDCGGQAVEYHHDSYEPEHWLSVIPLCRKCHRSHHSARVAQIEVA